MILLLKYKWAILALMIVTGAFFYGRHTMYADMQAKALETIKAMEAEHIKEMQEAAEIIGNEAEKQQEIRYVYRTLYKEADSIGDGMCFDDDGVELWNRASQATASAETDKPDGSM